MAHLKKLIYIVTFVRAIKYLQEIKVKIHFMKGFRFRLFKFSRLFWLSSLGESVVCKSPNSNKVMRLVVEQKGFISQNELDLKLDCQDDG